ncbi:hypothetical protein BBP00_00009889 [Phytophthora kernoviae]|uniref:EamA domain-containing protein n=1 Tax=Phytophthora kernoviae TaxID=325452 RepID=A0A3F2RBD3_9STRA|nr:hypothetical protein BBP00_00009889 [Phytophthora kernoviae]
MVHSEEFLRVLKPQVTEHTKLLNQDGVQTTVGFKKPFFIMCFSHAAPAVILPIIFAYYHLCGSLEDRRAGFDVIGVLQRHSVIPFSKLLRLSAFFGGFYLMSDYFWFAAFKNLTVEAGAAILNSIPLFVYCLSICVLREKPSARKLCGVLTAFAGVLLVVMYQGGSNPENLADSSVVAGLMMLIAAATSAVFEVLLALMVGDDMNDISTLLVFSGLCGVITIPLWLIGTIFFTYSPFPSLYEPVGFPDTADGVLMLTIAVVMFVINFVCLTISICWTSPLETSVGFMFSIPVSGLVDTVMHHTSFSWECIVGSVLVMSGFVLIEFRSLKPIANH